MWQTIIIISLGIFVYDLWCKVRALKNTQELGKQWTRFGIMPLGAFWDLRFVREAIGLPLDRQLKKDELKKLGMFGEFSKTEHKTLYQTYTFFPDKETLFSLTEWGGGFMSFPYKNTNLFYKVIGTTKDDYEISFNIAVRWYKDLPEFPKQHMPVYVGYLKKTKIGSKDDEMVILFELPHAFINPIFYRAKGSEEIIKRLEKRFGLEPKNDNDSFGDYTDDFGETAWFNEGHWHESKYYKIYYR